MSALSREWIRPRRWLTALLLVAAALAILVPTFQLPSAWGDPYDWRYFQSTEEIFRVSVVDYHQVPLWNPYMCGGEVALANPQSTVVAPTFLLTLLFGTALGLKLALLVYLLCALHGGYLLARQLGISWAGSLVCGIGFGGCGWFAMHLSSGHINFAGAALYPYLLVCYRRAVDVDWIWIVPGGALVAWMAGLGGTYTAPMGAVMLAAYAVGDAIRARRARPILVGGGIGAGALLLGAVRLLPVLEFVTRHPRPVVEKDANDLLDLGRAFFAWRQTLAPVGGHVYWWHEYCCHLAYLALALAAVAALWGARRRAALPLLVVVTAWSVFRLALPSLDVRLCRFYGYADAYHVLLFGSLWWGMRHGDTRELAPLVLIALGIAVGRAWPYGPWWMLRKLPLYHELRVPSRYLIIAAVPLSVWAGRGLDRVCALVEERGRNAARWAVALVALVALESIAFSLPTWRNVFNVTYERTPGHPAFHQLEGDKRWMFGGVLEGRGTLDCDEEAPLQRAEELDPGPVEQVRLLDPAAGSVHLDRWSPNELVITADLQRAADVLVNENWNEHWTVEGGQLGAVAGRLAVRAGAGKRVITLRYRPRMFFVGAKVSAVSLVAALLLLVWRWRRRKTG